MNEPSLRKFGPQVAPGGLIIYNRDRLPEDFAVEGNVRVICVPASEIADSLGSAKVANVVMLGALLQETECLPMESVMSVLTETVHNPKMLELDRQALEAGRKYVASRYTPIRISNRMDSRADFLELGYSNGNGGLACPPFFGAPRS